MKATPPLKSKRPGAGQWLPAGSAWLRTLAAAVTLLLAAMPLRALDIDSMTAEQLMTLMLAQPRLAVNEAVAPAASFDPPVIAPGGKAVYRVSLHALDEAITRWPDKLPVPPQLDLVRGAEGMIFNYGPGTMIPLTAINFHATAAQPGVYVIPAYDIEIYGKAVTIPEARLEVASGNPGLPSAHELVLEPAKTNVYLGEALRVRVLNPSENHVMPMLSEVQLNGDGFIAGKDSVRQEISTVQLPDGRDLLAFIYETSITPFTRGPLPLTAQGFTSGNQAGGPVIIRGGVVIPGGPPQFTLLESEPVTLNVLPLPQAGRLPGFNGAIGRFTREAPKLSATSIAVGNPVKLSVTFQSGENAAHLGMPEAPATPAWDVIANASPQFAGNSVTFVYTLIPQTDQTSATPEIPFCYFDPDAGQYVDLSIPAMPIQVSPNPGADTNGLAPLTGELTPEKKLSLSPLATTMGRTANSLVPLQERGWFFLVELGPMLGLAALWLASRRRLYLDQHPDLVRRRQARRALRREWRVLRQAALAGDASGFAASAVQAIRLACAPHFPAEPRALVCGDVLQLLPEAERAGATGQLVRRLFAATDARDFAGEPGEFGGLLELQNQLEQLLTQLEARL